MGLEAIALVDIEEARNTTLWPSFCSACPIPTELRAGPKAASGNRAMTFFTFAFFRAGVFAVTFFAMCFSPFRCF
jgi:hypothetical protein